MHKATLGFLQRWRFNSRSWNLSLIKVMYVHNKIMYLSHSEHLAFAADDAGLRFQPFLESIL
jgi:hypothetical protein